MVNNKFKDGDPANEVIKMLSEMAGRYGMELVPMQKESGDIWRPSMDDDFYFINEHGNIDRDTWSNDSSDIWKQRLGNCFKTDKGALKYREWLEANTAVQMACELHGVCFEQFFVNNMDSPESREVIESLGETYEIWLQGMFI